MNNETNPSSEPKGNGSFFSLSTFLTSAVAALALIGAAMMLAGFGVALAVETEFGIPHASVFKSSFDLLALSAWFELWVVSNLSTLLTEFLFSYEHWNIAGTALFITAVGTLSGFLIGHLYERHLKEKLKSTWLKISDRKQLVPLFLLSCISGLAAGLWAFIAAPLILGVVILATSVLAVIPLMSHTAAVAHIKKYVFEPEQCTPTNRKRNKDEEDNLSSEETRKKKTTAMCIRIRDRGTVIAEGRTVFGTTELIVLYDPRTHTVLRESLEGRTIEVVSELSSTEAMLIK